MFSPHICFVPPAERLICCPPGGTTHLPSRSTPQVSHTAQRGAHSSPRTPRASSKLTNFDRFLLTQVIALLAGSSAPAPPGGGRRSWRRCCAGERVR